MGRESIRRAQQGAHSPSPALAVPRTIRPTHQKEPAMITLVNFSILYYTSRIGSMNQTRLNTGGSMRKWFLGALVVLAASSVVAFAAHAQPALKMMIPANPGGGWDQTGRNLAAAMQSAKLVSGVQFDNKGGAAGTIGLAQFVNSAKGDPNAVMIGGMVMVGGIILNKSAVNLSQVTPIARLTSEWAASVRAA